MTDKRDVNCIMLDNGEFCPPYKALLKKIAKLESILESMKCTCSINASKNDLCSRCKALDDIE